MLEMIDWNPINSPEPGLVSVAVVHFRCVCPLMDPIVNAIEEHIKIQNQSNAEFIGIAVTHHIDRQLPDSMHCTLCHSAQPNRVSEARPSH